MNYEDESFNPYDISIHNAFTLQYRGFQCYPTLGIVINKKGSRGFKDKNGNWRIRGNKGKIHMVSHIIYASGHYGGFQISLQNMKNRIVKHKNNNKNDNRYNNLQSIVKKNLFAL